MDLKTRCQMALREARRGVAWHCRRPVGVGGQFWSKWRVRNRHWIFVGRPPPLPLKRMDLKTWCQMPLREARRGVTRTCRRLKGVRGHFWSKWWVKNRHWILVGRPLGATRRWKGRLNLATNSRKWQAFKNKLAWSRRTRTWGYRFHFGLRVASES